MAIEPVDPPPVRKARSRKLNRVGSRAPQIASTEAKTIGQRIAQRRLALGLSQAQVAKQVVYQTKTGRKKECEQILCRATLAMYEIDQAEPDLQKIIAIAKALQVAPAWLAFGFEWLAFGFETTSELANTDVSETKTDERYERWYALRILRPNDANVSIPEGCSVVVQIKR